MRLAAIFVPLILTSGCSLDGRLARAYLRPSRDCHYAPIDYGLAADDVRFAAADGTSLHGWLVHGDGSGRTVILFHDGELGAGAWLDWATPLAAAGMDVLAFDYRGFGTSGGEPSVASLTTDGRAAFAFVTDERHVVPGHVALVGFGIGAIPAISIASSDPAGALVVVGAFALDQRVRFDAGDFTEWLSEKWAFPDGWDAGSVARHVQCPVLVVHGEADAAPAPIDFLLRIPHEEKQLRQLEATGPAPEALFTNRRETTEALVRFLSRAFASEETQPLRTSWTYERGDVVVTILGPLTHSHAPVEAIVVYPRSGLLRVRGFLDQGSFEFRRPAREGVVTVRPCVYAHAIPRGDEWDEERDDASRAYLEWRDARTAIVSLLRDGNATEAHHRYESLAPDAPPCAAAWWGIIAFDVARALEARGD
ncbi:MAG: alpha/beta hydrolase [Planctomycetes bacterium]|nr:alpha/beta hydrolase [Planctomycetota bacterium]